MSKILPIGPDMGSNTTTRNNSAAGCDDDLVDDQEARVAKLSTVSRLLGEAEARYSSEIGPLDRGAIPSVERTR
jgi:hypothetical protein